MTGSPWHFKPPPACAFLVVPINLARTLTLTSGGDKSRFLSLYYRPQWSITHCFSCSFSHRQWFARVYSSDPSLALSSRGGGGRRESPGHPRPVIRPKPQRLRRPESLAALRSVLAQALRPRREAALS